MQSRLFLPRWLLGLLTGLPILLGGSLPGDAAAAPRSVHPAIRQPIDPAWAMHQRFLTHDSRGRPLVELLIEGDVAPGLLRARGIEVNTVVGRHRTARCPLELLEALLQMPGIDRVEIADRCEPELDLSIPDAGVSGLRTITPPTVTGQAGAGVLVGMVDSGIDLDHGDFLNTDGTTRLVSLWDQGASGTPPAGFTYGHEWSASDINLGLATETDNDGHGTHVMGIAAGDGSQTGNGQPAFRYVGVAPLADICVVKTAFSTTSILDGVNYIFQKAASLGMPCVVNLSLGSQQGPHDGTSEFDTMLNALVGPQRLVVASAGNRGEDDMHARVDVNDFQPHSMTLDVPTYSRKPGGGNDYVLFTGWYEGADQVSLTIESPTGITVGPVMVGDSLVGENTNDGYLNIYNGTTAPSNGDHEIYIELFDAFQQRPPESGTWTFTFTPISVASTGRVDMYTFASSLGTSSALARWVDGLVFGGVVGSPGSADSAIAVGAHTTKACWQALAGGTYCWNPAPPLNAIASFSSQGPRRDGVLKPDLTAPGFGVASATSSDYQVLSALRMPDGQHHMEAGTSMSAPHVTGTVALLLAQPSWSAAPASAIKSRLTETARADGFTGTLPNITWGYGKLDAAAATAPLVTLAIVHPPKGSFIPPGKPDSITVVVGGATADSIEVHLSLDGGLSYPVHLGTLYGVSPGPPQSVVYYVDPSLITTQAKARGTAHVGTASFLAESDSLFAIEAPVAVQSSPEGVPKRFALEPNRPNPFNPSTSIRFGLARPGRATLRVFTVRGALVRTLVKEDLAAGTYVARWDGRDDHGRAVGSGVYLYAFEAGGARLTRKMSLLR